MFDTVVFYAAWLGTAGRVYGRAGHGWARPGGARQGKGQ